jgi:hypothetical protein
MLEMQRDYQAMSSRPTLDELRHPEASSAIVIDLRRTPSL